MHFRRAARTPPASGGTDAFVQLNQIPEIETLLTENTDPAGEVRQLYRRALGIIRSEFEVRTWEAFWLTAVEGQSPADVAARTGVSPAAVRKAKSRVLRRLKEVVGEVVD
jgi:RNA polymerase sigma-70 factor (ECF subfamily)